MKFSFCIFEEKLSRNDLEKKSISSEPKNFQRFLKRLKQMSKIFRGILRQFVQNLVVSAFSRASRHVAFRVSVSVGFLW